MSSPASHPSTRGRLRVSRGSKPLQTSNHRAVSRTERVMQPDDHGEGWLEGPRAPRDAPVGRLEAEQPGEPGRDADGAATVAAAGDGEQASGHGRRRATRGAARGALGVPGVAGGAVQLGAGAVDAAELRGGGLAGQDGAGGPEPGDLGRVVGGHPVGEDQRGLGVGPPPDGLELLDPRSGTPPKGRETSAEAAVSRAASASRWLKALSSDASMAARDASRASTGESVPSRKASTREQASPAKAGRSRCRTLPATPSGRTVMPTAERLPVHRCRRRCAHGSGTSVGA